MPIGSSKLGVLGAGLVPGGTETFNAPGTFSIPPGVKKVSITGKGATGNPGNAGNAGTAGNPGTGAGGGAGGEGVASPGCAPLGQPGRGGCAVRRFANCPIAPFTAWANHPQWTCPSDPIRAARGGFLCPSFAQGNRTCPFPNNDSPSVQYAQAGQSGNAGAAGNPGNAGNAGQSSSGLCNTFPGGAGGAAGSAGAAGNGGTGGSAGGLGLYRPPAPNPSPSVLNKPCSGAAGGGGNGGGSGGSGVGRPTNIQLTTPGLAPGNCAQAFGGGGGGGAGVVNSGGSGGNGLKIRGGCCNTARTTSLGRRGAAGTDPASTAPNLEPNNPPAPRSQYINQPSVNNPAPAPILQQFCGMRNIPTNATGGLGGGSNVSGCQIAGSSLRFKFANLSRNPTVGAACNNCGFAPIFTSPSPSSLFRSGAGGGGGAGGNNPGCLPVAALGSGPGGGGGRGNAGNPGGSSPTPSGTAATPATFNCVPVTPGSTAPITVASPGGQVIISWNPQ